MIELGLWPLVVSVLLALTGPRLGRILSGRSAAVLLTAIGLICALSLGLVLSAIGCVALAQWPPLAVLGHWSPGVVATFEPLPLWVDLLCALLAGSLMCCAVYRLIASIRDLSAATKLSRRLAGRSAGDLVILDNDSRPDAYALAGLPGRAVVTRTMLRALAAPERRALLAHEASHVRHAHFVYVHLVRLAAAADPLLLPLIGEVRLAVERWADEDAARAVDDRTLVATTLARAGLAKGRYPVPRGALGANSHLAARIEALDESNSASAGRNLVVVLTLLLAAVGCVLTSSALGLHLHNLIEWAQSIDTRHRR